MELFIISFLIVYITYLVLILLRQKTLEKYKHSAEIIYVTKKYNIDINNINFKNFANNIIIINTFSISITFYLVSFVKSYLLQIVFSFGLILAIVYLLYQLIGGIYGKRI